MDEMASEMRAVGASDDLMMDNYKQGIHSYGSHNYHHQPTNSAEINSEQDAD